MAALPAPAATARARAAGLDEWAAGNLVGYLDEQRAATGRLPDDRTILVERFRDELGDWRVAVHSPFGARVNAPWALALVAALRQRYGVEAQAMHSDDGIVLRLPEADEPPPAALVVFAPDEVEAAVQAEVGGSALFASRFRELSLIHISEPTRLLSISYAVFCLKKKKQNNKKQNFSQYQTKKLTYTQVQRSKD